MPFITFEGIEGSGKSTQARRLGAVLGERALLSHEPGGTAFGREVRRLLLDSEALRIDALAELMLFLADRAQHVAEIVRPALESGRLVLCDRFSDSTIVYQGYARGLAVDLVRRLCSDATGGLDPDLTFVLDLPVEVGLDRAGRRGRTDRMEGEARAFHERVRAGYLDLARREPRRIVVIDAGRSEETIAAQVFETVREHGYIVGNGVSRDGL